MFFFSGVTEPGSGVVVSSSAAVEVSASPPVSDAKVNFEFKV